MKRPKLLSVVLLILLSVMVVLLLVPVFHGFCGSHHGYCLRMGANGRQIHLALFDRMVTSAAEENMPFGLSVWPAEGQFASSTDFFKMLVSKKWIQGVDYSFFSAPELPSMKDSMDPDQFTAMHNGWCVVMHSADDKRSWNEFVEMKSPFLFSKNIGFGDPPGPPWEGATLADMTGLIRKAKPFGDHLGVIVTYGGAVKVLPQQIATQANFNPNGARLKVLSP